MLRPGGVREVSRVHVALALAVALSARSAAAAAQLTAPAAAEPAEPRPWTLEALTAAVGASDARAAAAAAEAARLRAAEAERRAAGRWPTIDYLLFAGPAPELRNDPDQLDVVAAGSRLRTFDLGVAGLQTHLGATLTWPIWSPGRRAADEAAARGTSAGAAGAAAARARAAREAAEIYWTWQAARRNAAALEETDRQLAGARERADHMVGKAGVTKADLAQLDLARAELAVRRAEVLAARDLAVESARTAVGVTPEAPFALAAGPIEPPAVTLAPLARFEEAALASRPELQAAQDTVRARKAAADARAARRWPELVGTAYLDLNWTSSATPQTNPFAYDPWNRLWGGLGLALRGTFDPARLGPEQAEGEAEVERARAEAEETARAVRMDVARAHGALRVALERSARTRDAEAAARRWLAAAEAALDAGEGGAQGVLLAALASARAGADRVSAARDAHVALADLALATGTDPRTVAK
jgi:outer membrane protein TolC